MLIKTEIPGFVVKQEPSTPPNLMMGLKTIWKLFLFQVGPFVPPKRLEMGIFLTERDGPKDLLWKQQQGCHFVSFLMQIYGAKFQEHCFNISRDISFIQYFPLFSCKQYDVITDQIYIIEKR